MSQTFVDWERVVIDYSGDRTPEPSELTFFI